MDFETFTLPWGRRHALLVVLGHLRAAIAALLGLCRWVFCPGWARDRSIGRAMRRRTRTRAAGRGRSTVRRARPVGRSTDLVAGQVRCGRLFRSLRPGRPPGAKLSESAEWLFDHAGATHPCCSSTIKSADSPQVIARVCARTGARKARAAHLVRRQVWGLRSCIQAFLLAGRRLKASASR